MKKIRFGVRFLWSAVAAAPEEQDDVLQAFLKEKEFEVGVHPNFSSELGTVDIACLLEMLDKESLLPRTTDVLAFWKKRKERQTEQYALAQVVLVAPTTQVSVERAFSAVKFIL